MDNAREILPQEVMFASSPLEAARGADALILLTEWDVFRGIGMQDIKAAMRGTALFDGRNVYDPDEAKKAGLEYYGVGIGSRG